MGNTSGYPNAHTHTHTPTHIDTYVQYMSTLACAHELTCTYKLAHSHAQTYTRVGARTHARTRTCTGAVLMLNPDRAATWHTVCIAAINHYRQVRQQNFARAHSHRDSCAQGTHTHTDTSTHVRTGAPSHR